MAEYRLRGLDSSARYFLNLITDGSRNGGADARREEIDEWLARLDEKLVSGSSVPVVLPEKQQRLLARVREYRQPAMMSLLAGNAAVFREALDDRWPGGLFRHSLPDLLWEPGGSRLWSLKKPGGAWLLSCSDIFLLDPEGSVPIALASAVSAAARGRRSHNRALRDWARGEVVLGFEKKIGAAVVRDREAALGTHHDLHALFDSLNHRFFSGELQSGPLEWGRRRAYSRTGTYDPSTGAIRLSPALDSPGVPLYVVEYVLYHEMLHLAQDAGGALGPGQRIHTKAFRKLERRYPRWEEAERYLQGLASRKR